jgi:hypothetical protein
MDNYSAAHAVLSAGRCHLTFVVGLHHLSIDSGEFEIANVIQISSQLSGLQPWLFPQFVDSIGQSEWQFLNTTAALAYGIDESDHQLSETDGIQLLNSFLWQVSDYLTCLWFIKDNAASIETGYLQILQPDPAGVRVRVHSNFVARLVRKADGSRLDMHFTRSELQRASKLYNEVLTPLRTDLNLPPEPGDPVPAKFASRHGVNRLSRAIYFLTGARISPDLGTKLVFYCTVLESLFSTDATEVTHKVAHRLAVFLGTSLDDRIDIFRKVKRAYTIRSKVVHGDVVGKESAAQVRETSSDVDQTIRRALLKILTSVELTRVFQSDRQELEQYFLTESFRFD